MTLDAVYIYSDGDTRSSGIRFPLLEASVNSLATNFDWSKGDDLAIHLFHSGLSAVHIGTLRTLAWPGHLIDMDVSDIMKAGGHRDCWVKKPRIQAMVEADKAVFLDADTIVRSDLHELLGVDLGDCSAAGCLDVGMLGTGRRSGTYIWSGMMVYRPRDFLAVDYNAVESEISKLQFPDQDFVNTRFRVKVLPAEYHAVMNVFSLGIKVETLDKVTGSKFRSLTEYVNSGKVIHYPRSARPFSSKIPERVTDLWYRYWKRVDTRMFSFRNVTMNPESQLCDDFVIELHPSRENRAKEYAQPEFYTCRPGMSQYVADLGGRTITDVNFVRRLKASVSGRQVDLNELTEALNP